MGATASRATTPTADWSHQRLKLSPRSRRGVELVTLRRRGSRNKRSTSMTAPTAIFSVNESSRSPAVDLASETATAWSLASVLAGFDFSVGLGFKGLTFGSAGFA